MEDKNLLSTEKTNQFVYRYCEYARKICNPFCPCYSFMKAWITLFDLDWAAEVGEDRSKEGFIQQLKSPPKIRSYMDKSGSIEKTCLKQDSSFQLGA